MERAYRDRIAYLGIRPEIARRDVQHLEKCSEAYIVRSSPRRFLTQMELFERVSGSDNIAVSVEVRFRMREYHHVPHLLSFFSSGQKP